MKKISSCLLTVLLFLLFPLSAYADAGPKPSIDVKCRNIPYTFCYMDLLVEGIKGGIDTTSFTDETYDQELVGILKNYDVDGWRPAMSNGEDLIFGDILCEVEDGKCTQHFGYMVPDEFRIIAVSEKGDVMVSNIIKRKAFSSVIRFDFETGSAYEESIGIRYIFQFFITFLLTVIMEGLILLLFRFRLRESLKPFLIINLSTQLFLSALIYLGMYTIGIFGAILLYIFAEMVILILEAVLFSIYLKQHSRLRRVMFALTANIVSFFGGIFLMMNFLQ